MTGQTTWHRSLFRAGGRAAIVGALLGLIANFLHPITPTDDPEGVARVIADSELWVPVHLAIIVGLILMLGGLIAIYHSIGGGSPVSWRASGWWPPAPAPPSGWS